MNKISALTITAVAIGISLSGCKVKTINEGSNNSDDNQTAIFDQLLADEQKTPVVRPVYQASERRINDLIHTKLEVNFLWDTKQMNGQADLTLKPYFFTTDSLTLDAKAIKVSKVIMMTGGLEGESLQFTADGHFLKINLGREYTRDEQYTIRINYVANPEEVTQKGSAAISSAKGLYFINADG
ncbi:MAG: hypothetical protein JKY54_03005, partial [Flavobacteriales bacterium]|nr:hypothetical protein [Flavobacteriales bacterium]